MMKKLRIIALIMLCLFLLGGLSVIGVNAYVKGSVSDKILTLEYASELDGVDCIIVLGCGVKKNGEPSNMLKDRLSVGIELYDLGAAPKLLMSGDHGREEYNEVGVMKQYAVNFGISSEDVFMDHAGFSTYESIYRAKEVFEADKIIIVTQEYHLYRALYIADSFGIEAYGVSSDLQKYKGQTKMDLREVLARCKDFVTSIVKPKPTYLGKTIPVSGNGDLTNDY